MNEDNVLKEIMKFKTIKTLKVEYGDNNEVNCVEVEYKSEGRKRGKRKKVRGEEMERLKKELEVSFFIQINKSYGIS